MASAEVAFTVVADACRDTGGATGTPRFEYSWVVDQPTASPRTSPPATLPACRVTGLRRRYGPGSISSRPGVARRTVGVGFIAGDRCLAPAFRPGRAAHLGADHGHH